MKPSDLITYMEKKAKDNVSLAHLSTPKKNTFVVIDDPYDLEEFDNAIRNTLSFPAMLLEQNDGFLSDNGSANYTNTLRTSFMIIDRKKNDDKARDVRNRCYDIGFSILSSIRKDQPNKIITGKRVNMVINSAYIPVGPMEGQYYGYQFEVEFTAPISLI